MRPLSPLKLRPLLLAPLLSLGAAGLSGCAPRGVQPPESYDLSGRIGGDWGATAASAGPRLRLALVGTGVPGVVTNLGNQPQNVVGTPEGGWLFGLNLPRWPDLAGAYQVIAYDDANNSGTYDLGEPFARNRVWLLYSPRGGELPALRAPAGFPGSDEDALPAMTLTQGWNVYDRRAPLGANNPRPGPPAAPLTGYDLSR